MKVVVNGVTLPASTIVVGEGICKAISVMERKVMNPTAGNVHLPWCCFLSC